ncbi:MAG: VWA domain-containing protein [Pirellulaceae bacterium]
MSSDPSDVRITQYIFNELDEADKTAFEAELERNPELQKLVNDTRGTVTALQSDFQAEPVVGLSAEQRQKIELGIDNPSSAETGPDTARPAVPSRQLLFVLALAASLLLIVSVTVFGPWKGPARELAKNQQRHGQTSLETAMDDTLSNKLSSERDVETTDLKSIAGGSGTADPQAERQTDPIEADYRLQGPARVAPEPSPTSQQPSEGACGGLPARNKRPLDRGGRRELGKVKSPSPLIVSDSSQPRFKFGISKEEAKRDGWLSDEGRGPQEPGDRYDRIYENRFLRVSNNPLSTFSIDVDTASYSKVRMYLQQHRMLPRPDAVRIEELLNYFNYKYEPPTNDQPFAARVEVAQCPWAPKHRLARIGIKGREIERTNRPFSNLVFLLDVSGSMSSANKLPLLKRGMKMLVDQLGENDRVAIVVYAGAAGLVLDSTSADHKDVILGALDRLRAGGSTNGGDGIQLAYRVALDHFIKGGVNRVILCTDGDFNVGTTGTGSLVRLAEANAKTGTFLTVLGFGMGNHNDAMMEQISNKGNGNYAFIDTEKEAHKVLVEQISSTLVTIAKDVKIQIEFNPQKVAAFRLIGYENRILAAEDFNDDKKDAGEIGAGHTVTALYEIIPVGVESDALGDVDKLKYQKKTKPSNTANNGELLTIKLRYKQPDGDTSTLLKFPVKDTGKRFGEADQDFRFAAAVAQFGMLLRDSQFKGDSTYAALREIATEAAANDDSGYRQEFLELVKIAHELSGQ